MDGDALSRGNLPKTGRRVATDPIDRPSACQSPIPFNAPGRLSLSTMMSSSAGNRPQAAAKLSRRQPCGAFETRAVMTRRSCSKSHRDGEAEISAGSPAAG